MKTAGKQNTIRYEDFTPFVKATLEFTSFVLGDLVGLNKHFLPNSFKLHRLPLETETVFRVFVLNFM